MDNATTVAASNNTHQYNVEPLAYQSHGIPFSEWANLVTLCLAPLIAHVIGGVPKPVFLWQKPPRWHDRLWQFNPTTILWRYFIIADRRIRAREWSAHDMAASNAYFWTERGWDGSVAMMERSKAYCIRLPTHHRVKFVSGSMVTTVIVTVQGVLAIKTLVGGITGSYSTTINVGSIFYPLAFFGLLRLFAAFWLTDDYLYYGDIETLRSTTTSLPDALSKEIPLLEVTGQTNTGFSVETHDVLFSDRFHPAKSWRGILFRIIYLVPLGCIVAMCLVYLIPSAVGTEFTVTALLMVLFYTFFLAGSLCLFAFYFLTGRTTSSIIPCATALWYKIYTAAVIAFMLTLVIIACIQTRSTPCGIYTTYPNNYLYDAGICTKPGGIPVGPASQLQFHSIEASVPVVDGRANFSLSADKSLSQDVVFSIEGWCFGKITDNGAIVNKVTTLNSTATAS